MPSNASAVRLPVPVTMTARALPLAQPGRPTISRTTDERSGVRWSGPCTCFVGHGGGTHATLAPVRGRDETSNALEEKVAGLSAA